MWRIRPLTIDWNSLVIINVDAQHEDVTNWNRYSASAPVTKLLTDQTWHEAISYDNLGLIYFFIPHYTDNFVSNKRLLLARFSMGQVGFRTLIDWLQSYWLKHFQVLPTRRILWKSRCCNLRTETSKQTLVLLGQKINQCISWATLADVIYTIRMTC